MNLIAIVACAIAGSAITVCVYACLIAAGQADDWAEQFHDQLNREEVERRTLYHEARKRAAQ